MDNQILAHTKYNCTYHIVFIPKYRRKAMDGKLGEEVGQILSTVCKITGIDLIRGGVCPNHVHLYVSISRRERPTKSNEETGAQLNIVASVILSCLNLAWV